MKKTLAILLTLVMLFATAIAVIPVSADVEPNEDWDADADGVYRIRTAADLLAFSSYASFNNYYKDKTVELANDIDMKDVEFFMIAEFHGTLDGKNHAIKDLSMATEGFIRKLMNGAVIKNIRFENVTQTSNVAQTSDTGVIALSATGVVEFNNVYVQGSVSTAAVHKKTGGFLSWTNPNTSPATVVTFTDCVSAVKATGTRAGGFVGQTNKNTSVVFNDCSFIGDLSGGTQWSSNFAGLTIGNVEMNRCVSLGKSSTHKESGVLVYLDHQNSATDVTANIKLNDCYAAVADGQYAVGANATRSFCQTLTVSYNGTQAIKIEATAQDNNIASKRDDLEAAMQYIAKGDTVNVTKDNFAEKCPALAKDNKWVVMGDETVAYADGKTAVKLMSAKSKALLETPAAPAEGTGDSGNTDNGNTDNGENNENGNNTDNGGNDANTNTPSDTTPETKDETKADDTTADTEEEKKSGCGSVIGGSVIAVAAVMSCAAVFAGKKKED